MKIHFHGFIRKPRPSWPAGIAQEQSVLSDGGPGMWPVRFGFVSDCSNP